MPKHPHADQVVIDDYLSFKAIRWGARTIHQRRWQLQVIAERMPAPLIEATEADVLQWHANLRGGPETVASYLSAIRGIYRWMSVQSRPRLRSDDPTVLLERPRIPEAAPRPMSERHLDLAVACSASDPEIWLWLGLMGCCGLRCCEIAWLQTHDVEVVGRDGGGLMHVLGKGQKRRTVPIPATFLLVMRPFLSGPGSVFTRASDGRPYSPKDVSQRMNGWLRGLRIHETAHTLRHRFAGDYHALDPDLYRQAKIMGHGSVNTTQRYTTVDPSEAGRFVQMLAEQRFGGRGHGRGRAA